MLTPAELEAMTSANEGLMADEAEWFHWTPVEEYPETNTVRHDWVSQGRTRCGAKMTAREINISGEIHQIAVVLRVPKDLSELQLDHRDRFKLWKRYGEVVVNPPVLAIVGMPVRGPSAIVLNCEQVTDGSLA